MKNKIKIILVIHSLQKGGMERVMSILANEFSKVKNIELHIILYGISPKIFYILPNNITIHKPAFKFVPSRRFLSTLKTINFLRNKFKELKPTTVLSFGEMWNNLVLISGINLNLRLFVSDRAQPDLSLGLLHNTLRKWLYPMAKGVIIQTNYAKNIYKNSINNPNVIVIGNPIKSSVKSDIIKKENIILSVGRLVNSKHHDRLIQLFSKIDNPNWKLVLVGGDAQKQKNKDRLTQLIKELNMEETVVLAGNQKDVDSYYNKSKIFAFTSSSEGFPNVIGEAMAAGLPIVTYDCISGPSEIIRNNEDGYLIPLFNDEEFLIKLENLMNNEILRKRMGDKAKENIKRFDSKHISDKFLEAIS